FENRALAFACAYKAAHGAHLTAVTMGPPQAAEILEQALALGADDALHLCSPAFAGSDTLATARALAAALRGRPLDLVLCGRHSTDSETGQIGPELAELLGLPHVTGVRRLDVDEAARRITVERETDDGIAVLALPLPALVTVAEGIGEEAWPAPAAMAGVERDRIVTLGPEDIGLPPAQAGAAGSPTWVGEVYAEQNARLGVVLNEGSPEELAERLVALLIEKDAFAARTEAPPRATRRSPERGGAVWCVAEHHEGRPRAVSFELLGAAARIADALGGHTAALLLGGSEELAAMLARAGADEVLHAPDAGDRYDMERYAATLAEAIRHEGPLVVLVPASADGRDLAPRVAARLGLGLTGDCLDVTVDAEGEIVQLKPAFGGNIVAPVYSRTRPVMATVRPGVLTAPAPLPSAEPRLRRLETPAVQSVIRLLELRPDAAAGADRLTHANVVIGVGRGLGGPENLPAVRALARTLGAEIGASRVVTDLGWLPRQRQIGLTGRAIAPSVYIAVGISGSFNHLVGVLKAGTIVAVNRSPRAPIARAADYTLVGDWAELVPALDHAFAHARTEGRLRL
ncbi:MAG TPA: FAD-binding protein, partial [Dehalococcoidia bacterium]|nr:FAD-binding protein [Dehalococcoidia bacterium]